MFDVIIATLFYTLPYMLNEGKQVIGVCTFMQQSCSTGLFQSIEQVFCFKFSLYRGLVWTFNIPVQERNVT